MPEQLQSCPPSLVDDKPSFMQLQQAAEWFATLRAEDASEADRVRWHQWLSQDDRHRAAWQRVEAVNAEFNLLSPVIDHRVLSPQGRSRRRAIKTLAWVAAGVGVAGTLGQSGQLRDYVAALHAQYRTGIGQTRQQQLADGSTLWLNTASAADVDFDNAWRRVMLHRGELMIQTAHDAQLPPRPLVVDVRAGRLQALGTRFLVRLVDGATLLTVLQGQVRITPAGMAAPVVVPAGTRVRFTEDLVEAPQPADDSMAAWSRHLLMPDGVRLDDFLAELGRYRHGYLGCAPEVAGLRLVGVYPLDDTDRVLQALEATLPVRVTRILPWWVSIDAAPAPA